MKVAYYSPEQMKACDLTELQMEQFSECDLLIVEDNIPHARYYVSFMKETYGWHCEIKTLTTTQVLMDAISAHYGMDCKDNDMKIAEYVLAHYAKLPLKELRSQ